ncbi:MAG: hypothetical protein K6A37_10225 [Saccharofermentans sp.]|nr:hypothetical protein [Saccharofermentans sp.]
MDMWNEKLTRENFESFYNSTVDMVYSSTYGVCKETTRTENAIVKSYIETYQQRSSIRGEDVLYVFGDILLKNAEDIVEKYPLPEGLNFMPRTLDEYTRNSMLEKITAKLDSTGYKVAEFISSENKKGKPSRAVQKVLDVFPVTPLLAIQLVLLAIIIWLVSTVSVTLINKEDNDLKEDAVYESFDLQNKYVAVLDYYPLNVDYIVTAEPADEAYEGEAVETAPAEEIADPLAPVIAETEEAEPSATRG